MQNFFKFTLLLLPVTASAQGTFNVDIESLSSKFCTGSPVYFNALPQGSGVTYTWSVFPDRGAIIQPDRNSASIAVTFSTAQSYSLVLAGSNGTETAFA